MKDTSDALSKPLYRQIADKIVEEIRNGAFEDELPPQEQLADHYGVGRSSIREALRLLDEQGIIRVRQGASTRVLGITPLITIQPGLESFVGVSKLIRSAGYVPGTSFIQLRRTLSSSFFFPAFSGSSVIVMERVRMADQMPVVFSVDVFEDRGWNLEDMERKVSQGSLLEVLSDVGIVVGFAESTLRPLDADPVISERLGLASGEPVLFIEEISYNTSGKIVICSYDYYHPRNINFRVVRRAES